jgi:hypothetical protein
MLLVAHDMTALKLAEHLGLGRTPIYDRLRGLKPFTVAEVDAMCRIFDVTPSVFFEGPPKSMFRGHSSTATDPGLKSTMISRPIPLVPSPDRMVLPLAA